MPAFVGSRAFTLLASAARSTAVALADGAQTPALAERWGAGGCLFTLDVTEAGSAAGDTLDVVIQGQFGNGSWIDIVYFTQVLGNGGAKQECVKVLAAGSQAAFQGGTALTAGNSRNILSDLLRVKYGLVNGGGTHAFTFGVYGYPL